MSEGATISTMTENDRWAAVLARDEADFYYSVRTTGVYCRPSCAARRPRRENVSFHATVDDAEGAGFRPCRRCRPDEAPAAERRAAVVADACRAIEAADDGPPPSVDELAAAAGLSRSHFHRAFKTVTGVTPKAYATEARNRRVREALAGSGRSGRVTDVIYDAGFNSNGRFYASSTAALGMTPTTFRRAGPGSPSASVSASAHWDRCWWQPPTSACAPSSWVTTPTLSSTTWRTASPGPS